MSEQHAQPTTSHIAALLGAIALCLCSAAGAQDWQSLEEIRETAIAHVNVNLAQDGLRRTVSVGHLDARLRLARCGEPLEAFLPHGMRSGKSTTVGVRCRGPKAWKIYVPTRVVTRGMVLIAKRPLRRDAEIGPADVMLVARDLDSLPAGYIDDAEMALGKRLIRSAANGAVLTPGMLGASRMIQRGQTVTLRATGGGLNINMDGEALADGTLGERIRVRNLSSSRVIEGVVRSAEVVEVLLN